MQSPEEFIKEYLTAYAAETASEEERRRPFRRKFFAERCMWDSREGVVDQIRAEVIESVEASENEAKVISHNGKRAVAFSRLRYCLKTNGETWLIEKVDTECELCLRRKAIDSGCPFCHGTGWIDFETLKNLSARRQQNPPDTSGEKSTDR